MLLTADIGNTHTVLGLWQNREIVATCRLSSDKNRTEFEWLALIESWLFKNSISGNDIKSVVYCSVVPGLDNTIEATFNALDIQKIKKLTHATSLPFRFDYADHATIGTDRLANTIATIENYSDNAIIVDFGTAITFCLVQNRIYMGGLIAPGIYSSLDALFAKTAKLPQVSFDQQKSILGKSTNESIEKGAYFGWKGLVREIITELKKKAEQNKPLKVVATGGMAENLGFAHEFFDIVDKNLTLRGLMCVGVDE